MKLDVNVNKKGLVKKSPGQLNEESKKVVSNVITRLATFMERTAKENLQEGVYNTPNPSIPNYVRSGKARQSITRSPIGPFTQKVFMGVNYGIYIEKGTGIYRNRRPYWTTFGGLLDRPIFYKGMKPRPFWKPAINSTKKQVETIFKQESSKLNK